MTLQTGQSQVFWLGQGRRGSREALSETLFLPPHQDWQRDWPSLPHQGPEEGRFLPTEGPVQPPPQEQPQRKAVRDGVVPGGWGDAGEGPGGGLKKAFLSHLLDPHVFSPFSRPSFFGPCQRQAM